jgi:hypothetical protein
MTEKRNGLLGGEDLRGEGSRQAATRWLTPRPIVEALGAFDLDPCGAPDHELAAKTYLLEHGEDGLTLPWSGRVWLNPPYGRQAVPFLERMAEHGDGIALIFARTETAMFQRYVWQAATAILFLSKRITFLSAEHREVANAGAPSVLVAYGADNAEALLRSGLPGYVTALWVST